MTKILILDVTESTTTNRGAMATVLGAVECLNPLPLELFAFSARISEDRRLEKYGLKVLPHPWYTMHNSKIRVLLSCIFKIPADSVSVIFKRSLRKIGLKIPLQYDDFSAVLVLDADSFNEKYYGSLLTVFRLINLYLAKILIRKPVFLGPATIGRFTNPLSRLLAKNIFKALDSVAAREETTFDYLVELGRNKENVSLIPELAYIMAPPPPIAIDDILSREVLKKTDKLLVGIAPSQQLPLLGLFTAYPLAERQEMNLKLMLSLIDHIQTQYQADIVLVAHSPNYQSSKDDRIICRMLSDYQATVNSKMQYIKGDYAADELKGIIGRCDLFIGCRMHASIAAASQCIPTLSLAYGQKYAGVMGKMLDLNDYIVNVENRDYAELEKTLISKIDDMFVHKEQIREKLTQRMESLKIQLQEYAHLTGELSK
jgi:colanic acid/amylovoran biosynthesis protein